MGVYIQPDQASVEEGEAATFTLTRYGGGADNLERPLHVAVEVTQEGDYIAGSAPQTVTFQANATTATLTVPTANDEVDEPAGAINARLLRSVDRADFERSYDISRYSGIYSVDRVSTVVTDPDYTPRSISISDARATEDNRSPNYRGRLSFRVALDSPTLERTITVDWATGDDPGAVQTQSAAAGVDYTAAAGTLTFAPGETVKEGVRRPAP